MIAAGPAVNLVLGFVLLVVFFSAVGDHDAARHGRSVDRGFPAQGRLHAGDKHRWPSTAAAAASSARKIG